MSCGDSGYTRYHYTGNQVGYYNYTGDFNFVSGGPAGSSLSAGTTTGVFVRNTLSRRIWEAPSARFNDALLDATYPVINLQWFAEIYLDTDVVFRVSNRAFYVQDADDLPRFYDARAERAPSINVTVGEWLNSNYEVSDVTLILNNRDGYYNQYLPYGANYRQWSGARIVIKVGFSELYDNYFTLFEGQVSVKEGLTTTRDEIEVRAYDKLDLDEIPIPPNSFSADTYPDIGEDGAGKSVPLVYGDWTENVPTWGAVGATCINAGDDEATSYEFKVSDLALESIDSVWLHRGNRKEDLPEGPIEFDFAELDVDLEGGSFTVPVGTDVFATEAVLLDNQSAGSGSGLNSITAKDASVDFVAQRIQVGDRIIKRSTGAIATVSSVAVSVLGLSGGVTFALDDEYVILTSKYKFIKGDKISVVCKGKRLNLISVTRLESVDPDITDPKGISVALNGTYWIADNDTQKVYNITFDNEIVTSIDYADIDPGITDISGISAASDGFIWVVDPSSSTVFRYDQANGALGLSFTTGSVTSMPATLANVTGIVAKADNKIWIVDQATAAFYEIDAFSATNPFVVTTFTKAAFDTLATDLEDVGYDEAENQVIAIDRDTLKSYRLNETTGALVSEITLSDVADNLEFPSGVCSAQDGTLFFLDTGTLTIYNYNDLSYASVNPCFMARDILQKFGGHTYEEFDLSWNQTARQLATYKARVVLKDKANVITFINGLLRQYNVVFHLRFQKYSLFWITFDNFRSNGRLVKEKDLQQDSFKPGKENNQYFNSATATYDKRAFTDKSLTSDTYVSPAGVAFARKEVNRKLDMPNVYRRADIDKLMPLFVRLSVPEPEFVQATFGFRVIRTQMQDFLKVNFDGDANIITGVKESGRRFNDVPCMVRSIKYDLGPMTTSMKLWSLGSTAFPGYTPTGRTVGGDGDEVVLTNLGRAGRVSPVGHITASSGTSVTLADVSAVDAETRTSVSAGLAWAPGYRVALVDGSTKEILQTLTIDSVSGAVVTFLEAVTATVTATTDNTAGFITGGVYLQYSNYEDMTEIQRGLYASFCKPVSSYPTSRTQELEEQRGGVHNFDDGGLAYVFYPEDYLSYT